MNITLNKSRSPDRLLTVTLSEEDYQPRVTKKIKEYARKATVKGFRKGKAPQGMIQKMYGLPVLMEEVNTLVSQSISQYIKDNKLKIIGEPLPDKKKIEATDWNKQKDFNFEFRIGLVDDFKYKLSSRVKLKSYPIEITDSMAQDTISNLQKQFGTTANPEISDVHDYLQGQVTAEESGVEYPHAYVEINKVKQDAQHQFIGKKKNEELVFDIDTVFTSLEEKAQFLNLHTPAEATSQKGLYRFTINTISRAVSAPINQALFDKVLGKDSVHSEDEFIAKVKDSMGQQYQQETSRLLDKHIQDHFIENTKIDMPEDFLRAWLKDNSHKNAAEEALETALSSQKNMLKWDLIKNKMAEDLSLRVDAEDVKKRARELVGQQYGGPSTDAELNQRLDAFTEQYLSDQEGANFNKLYAHLQNERVLNAIKETITIAEKPVSLDEFKKLVDNG